MYIFAEPVTEERVAEIQSHNEAKIKEFERKLFGLTSDETMAQETEDDDSKWENIQADVRETMDKDELSIEQPNSEDVEDEDSENTPVASNGKDNSREGGLFADRDEAREGDEATSTAAEGEDDEDDDDDELLENDEDEEVEEPDGEKLEELTDEADEEQDLDEESLEDADDSKQKIGEEVQVANENEEEEELQGGDGEEAAREEESTYVDPEHGQADDQSVSAADEEHAESQSNKELLTEGNEQKSLRAGSPERATPPIHHTKQDTGGNADSYTWPPSSEAQSDFPLVADKAFLSKVTEELSPTGAATSQSSDILALTLTIRNKVNDKFVLRPERLTAKDKWTIEYSLNEVDTETRARALYQACQARRKKKYDKMETNSDEENINGYLQRLRELSMQGRKWRARQDEEDTKKPVQILGDVIGERPGEGDGVELKSHD